MRVRFLIPALFALSGCTGALLSLKAADPQAGDYASALAAEYLAYSESQAEQGHITDAEYFADKGLRALHGETAEPEPAASDAQTALRGRLLALSTDDIRRVAAQKAARAQLLYDCTAHQQTGDAGIAPCAEELDATLTELQMIADAFTYGEETRHSVHFAPRSARLSGKAISELRSMARRATCQTKYAIEIHVGLDKKNAALAHKRAQSIRGALIANRVPPEWISMVTEDTSGVVHLSSDEDTVDRDTLQVVMRAFNLL